MKKDNGIIFSLNNITCFRYTLFKKSFKVIPSLDNLILKGKIYLTKDSILKKKQFKNMYDQFNYLKNFEKI